VIYKYGTLYTSITSIDMKALVSVYSLYNNITLA